MTSETVSYTAAKIGGLRRKMKLTSAARNRLPSSTFALPDRRYPVNNASHARNALSRVSQFGTPREKARVRAKVHAKFPDIGKGRLSSKLTSMRKAGSFRKPAAY